MLILLLFLLHDILYYTLYEVPFCNPDFTGGFVGKYIHIPTAEIISIKKHPQNNHSHILIFRRISGIL